MIPGIVASRIIAAAGGFVQLDDATDSNTQPTFASAGFTFTTNGNTTKVSGDSYNVPWWSDYPETDIGNNYEIMASVDSGTNPAGDSLDTWLALTSDRNWQHNSFETFKTCVLTISIRLNGGATQDTATYTIFATGTP